MLIPARVLHNWDFDGWKVGLWWGRGDEEGQGSVTVNLVSVTTQETITVNYATGMIQC